MALTKKQRSIIKSIPDGGFMRKHLRPDGIECYRLLTADSRPVANISAGILQRLNGGGVFGL